MIPAKRRKTDGTKLPRKLDKRQRKHLQQYGEINPADLEETGKEFYRKVKDEDTSDVVKKTQPDDYEDSESEEEEEASHYQKLVSTLAAQVSSDSGEEESDEDDSVGEEDDEELNDSDEEALGVLEDDEELAEEEIGEENPNVGDGEDYGRDSKDGSNDEDDDGEENIIEDDYREEIDNSDDEVDRDNVGLKEDDPFTVHFEKNVPEELAVKLDQSSEWTTHQTQIPHIGRCAVALPKDSKEKLDISIEKDVKKLHLKRTLANQLLVTNKKYANVNLQGDDSLTGLQSSLFSIVNRYQDLYYPNRTSDNSEEIRLFYCLHALNHVLKTRSRVVAHNSKIKSKREEVPDDYRDQGLTRPKVLIVLPFRESALKVVKMFILLLTNENQSFVEYKKRFFNEYGEEEPNEPENKPEDFVKTFAGNIDDHFRIGIGIAKKSIKLYTKFYSSDIILASPLGLRTIIGAEGEPERDHDFLSSIEVLIFDQMEMFLMQNWDHINHLMSHMHLQPKESHDVDFSRVRMWTLNGWSKFYRQTLIFSSMTVPEINAVFNKNCHNYAGKFQFPKVLSRGSICQIHTQLPQVFHRIDVTSFSQVAEARFEYFKSKVLPQYKDDVMCNTMIFIPSYFDFVRLRNYFKAQELDFVHISEYSSKKQISKARNGFSKRGKHFMLFTERFHFFNRLKIKEIKHIVFYDLPYFAHLYSEMCNFIPDPQKSRRAVNWDVTVLYTKYDAQKLAAIVGNERAGQMIKSEKNIHMFVTGDS